MLAISRRGVLACSVLLSAGVPAGRSIAAGPVASGAPCGLRFLIYVNRARTLLPNPVVRAVVEDHSGSPILEIGRAGAPDTWMHDHYGELYVDCVPPGRAAALAVTVRTENGFEAASRCAIPRVSDPYMVDWGLWFIVEPLVTVKGEGADKVVSGRDIWPLDANHVLSGIEIAHSETHPTGSS